MGQGPCWDEPILQLRRGARAALCQAFDLFLAALERCTDFAPVPHRLQVRSGVALLSVLPPSAYLSKSWLAWIPSPANSRATQTLSFLQLWSRPSQAAYSASSAAPMSEKPTPVIVPVGFAPEMSGAGPCDPGAGTGAPGANAAVHLPTIAGGGGSRGGAGISWPGSRRLPTHPGDSVEEEDPRPECQVAAGRGAPSTL